MAFSESIKVEVRKRAHLCCCLCKSIGVEVHHIIPQDESGADTIDNAAPLCPACHEIYGANSTKRKMIREAREIWYEICEKRFASDAAQIAELSNQVKNLPAILGDVVAESVIAKLIKDGVIKTNLGKTKRGWPLNKVIELFLSFSTDRSSFSDLDVEVAFKLIFNSPGDKNDPRDKEFNLVRDAFHKIFGELLAKKLCIYVLKLKPVNFQEWTAEKEFLDLLQSAFVIMFLLLSHEDMIKLNPIESLPLKIRFDENLELHAMFDRPSK